MLYETAKMALEQLTDDRALERVALRVLRKRYPNLRLTSATGDTGLDGYSRPLFEDEIDVALWVSLQGTWTTKLTIELEKHKQHGRTAPAVFVMNRSTTEIKKDQERERAKTDFGVSLEIIDLAELVVELESDDLRWVAEAELGVRPCQPRSLSTAEVYLERLSRTVPGMAAELRGTAEIQSQLRARLTPGSCEDRVVVVEGPGGSGKTRIAIETARSVATTLVVPSGAPFTLDSFTEVGLDAPLILVIDDAHRSESLSAVAAMLADQRFDRVRLILTVRPGQRERTLYTAGAEHQAGTSVVLGRLDRPEIDTIITDHGIQLDEFRTAAIGLADGNPLIAHTACQVALANGKFDWSDASDLLRELIASRLLALGDPSLHRTVAVALALLTKAGDPAGHHGGQDIAVLHGAVSGLPSEPDRLDRLLDDLADAGLVDTPPCTFRPDLAAAVVLADALTPEAKVRLDPEAALRRLAAHSGLTPEMTPQEHADALDAATRQLDPQIGVLAAAARDSGNRAAASAITAFVLGLLPEDAHLGHWTSVVRLASQAVPADPTLLAQLTERLIRQWPVPASEQLWGDTDAVAYYRFELDRLCQEFARLAGRINPETTSAAVASVLDIAWLADAARPVFGGHQPDTLLRTFQTWAGPKSWHNGQALMARRGTLLGAISRWVRDRTDEPPLGLDVADAAKRGPESVARVLLAALQPYLTVMIELVRHATPEQANTLTIRTATLPDLPETQHQLDQALDLLEPLLAEPALHQPEHLNLLNALVAVPEQLRQIAGRGLPGNHHQPLPTHAEQLLAEAATRFAEKIAARWTDLPLSVRRRAAEAALGTGTRRTDLAGAAANGEPVAVAALSDPELSRLLVVQPPNTFTATWAEDVEAQKSTAIALAGQLTTAQAIDLLEAADPSCFGTAREVLPAFAAAVGENATGADPVLDRIARGPLSGDAGLLAGLATRHPKQVWQWVFQCAVDPRIAELALAMADDHPEQEEQLLRALADAATGTEVADPAAICAQVARHAWHCTRSAEDRLGRLALLGTRGPDQAVPEVLQAIGMVLHSNAPVDPETVNACVAVLERGLTTDANDLVNNDGLGLISHGVIQIARRSPGGFAQVLTGHALGGHRLPASWTEHLERLDIAVRDEITAAFEQRWSAAPATVLDDLVEDVLCETFTAIGKDTDAWSRALVEWAGGPPSARRRAAKSVHLAWTSRTWAQVVPELLVAGLTPDGEELILHGLTAVNAVFTDLDAVICPRREAAEKLKAHPDALVQAFATTALERLDHFASAFLSMQHRSRTGYLT
ncbi:hypothetical protein OU787_25255 [Kitasatospora sp. YST-16]|uniref:hypothetical protein n=1 Tax=Kitasatospora sp. YST-16 TaxID=2998080 RepID=UPI002284A9C4|nr:hypothetical protein [Kitasatospora sp. YST-16]WAL74507.1 hypothetical protein OU787_25255 [Kitasatospora sp. YST-16]WNW40569.1 hypothetical protein RKE32_25210 [Streptomyces sp. Li-HN-5-13]